MSKKLVAYFSATGKTKKIAEALAEKTGADLFRITPAVPYTMDDLNWRSRFSRSSVEMRDRNSRPALAETLDLSPYDTVYLGFPIWWYVAPTVVNTFLESTDTAGKRIVLFATSGCSGFGKTRQELMPSAPDAELIEGAVISGLFRKSKIEAIAALG